MNTTIRKKLLSEVTQTVRAYNMLTRVKKVVVAFSCGPDSVCLLDVLHTLYGNEVEFHLVYVNHHLRPERHLKAEEDLLHYYTKKYRLTGSVKHVKIIKKRTGLEAAARDKRYEALQECMNEVGAQAIAVGHTLDDVIETFFMNMLRGSGTRGLSSIPAKREQFIRPLINVRKAAVLEYLRNRRLKYSRDVTNILPDYRRNILRNRIIPELLTMYPDLHRTIAREIGLLRTDDKCLDEQAQRVYRRVARSGSGQVLLDINNLLKYNQSIANRVIMRAVKDLRGDLTGFESKHFREILSLTDKASGKQIQLPKGLHARREYGTIAIGLTTSHRRLEIPVDCNQDTVTVAGLKVSVRTVSTFALKYKKKNCEVFDRDQVFKPVVIRNRRTGDVVRTKIGHKKMKKIYNEYKIPLRKRNDLMMLCDRKGILWIFGYVRAFRAYCTARTKRVLVVGYERTH